jgi:hypothetical protein
MAKSRRRKPKQGPPITFRPGPELERLVSGFASAHGFGTREAFKRLAALAAVGMDVRYHDLVSLLAGRLSGRNSFVQAALQVHTALISAASVDRLYACDPHRAAFVIEAVCRAIGEVNSSARAQVVDPLRVRLGLAAAPGANAIGVEEEEPAPSTVELAKIPILQEE